MPLEIGFVAIRRAARSLRPGGMLELGFFGGEPLLEAEAIARWIDFTQRSRPPPDLACAWA